MGIRVHKIVGWGVDNFVPPNDFDEKMERLYEISGKEFSDWLENNKEKIKNLSNVKHSKTFEFAWFFLQEGVKKIDKYSRLSPGYTISYDDEFGLKGHLVISPFELIKQCKRYDDLIDWLEEDHEPRWRWLDKGICPNSLGEKPVSVIAMCVFLGTEDIIQNLKEVLYVYWS